MCKMKLLLITLMSDHGVSFKEATDPTLDTRINRMIKPILIGRYRFVISKHTSIYGGESVRCAIEILLITFTKLSSNKTKHLII